MAKLYFYYGAMGASKTAQALMTRFNYVEKGQKALLAKADLDTRDDSGGKTLLKSRVGLEAECVLLSEVCKRLSEDDADKYIKEYDVVIVDEAQFATAEQIMCLVDIVDIYGIPVICYGLRSDFRGELFPGSERLLALADKILEIKTMCWCGRKATMNARFNENGIIKEGEQVVLGANSNYTALCRKHWALGMLEENNL